MADVMKFGRRTWGLLAAVALTLSLTQPLAAQTADAPSDGGNLKAREEALAWIDKFGGDTVLFHEADVKKVRDRLAKATPEQAQEWLDRTAEMRAALDSPEWKETQKWLKQFLRVQAIYSDEQIDAMRKEVLAAAEAGETDKFKDMLDEIENRRSQLAQGAATSAQLRDQQVKLVEAFKQQAMEERAAMRQSEAQALAAAPANNPPVQRREYVRPAPLVTSLDVARWSIMRNFWGRW